MRRLFACMSVVTSAAPDACGSWSGIFTKHYAVPPDEGEARSVESRGYRTRPSPLTCLAGTSAGAVLRALFADAVEEGVLRSSPTTGLRVSVPSTDDGDEPAKAMTRAELNRVLDESRASLAGCSSSSCAHGAPDSRSHQAARGATCRSVSGPTIFVSGASSVMARLSAEDAAGRRTIPLAPAMADRLRALEGPPDALVFTPATTWPADQSLEPLAQTSCVRAAERAGVPWVSFHTFRHTWLALFAAGKNVKQVQAWLVMPTRASPCGRTSTSWTRASAMPTSSMTSSAAGVPLVAAMTAKEKLRQVVDDLSEDQAADFLQLLSSPATSTATPWRRSSMGSPVRLRGPSSAASKRERARRHRLTTCVVPRVELTASRSVKSRLSSRPRAAGQHLGARLQQSQRAGAVSARGTNARRIVDGLSFCPRALAVQVMPVYTYIEADDRVVLVTAQDGRTSTAPRPSA